VNFHEGARRLFVGDVAIQPSFRLDAANSPRLFLTFSAPSIHDRHRTGQAADDFQRDPIVSREPIDFFRQQGHHHAVTPRATATPNWT